MRSGLVFFVVFCLVATLFASDIPEAVKWGVFAGLGVIALLSHRVAVSRSHRISLQAKRDFERWQENLPNRDRFTVEEALRRGVAAPAELAGYAAEGARLKLEMSPPFPPHETEFERRRGFAVVLGVGGFIVFIVALQATALAPWGAVGATWVVIGPIQYATTVHAERKLTRALTLNSMATNHIPRPSSPLR